MDHRQVFACLWVLKASVRWVLITSLSLVSPFEPNTIPPLKNSGSHPRMDIINTSWAVLSKQQLHWNLILLRLNSSAEQKQSSRVCEGSMIGFSSYVLTSWYSWQTKVPKIRSTEARVQMSGGEWRTWPITSLLKTGPQPRIKRVYAGLGSP